MIDESALVELGWRIQDLVLLCAEMCEEIAELRRRPLVVVVVIRDDQCPDVYEAEAEDVPTLPDGGVELTVIQG